MAFDMKNTFQDALAESPLTRFGQVGFANVDTDRIAHNLAEKFGLGPWRIQNLKMPDGTIVSTVGRAWISGIDFELIQARFPMLLHYQFAEKRGGDTMHHLCFYPDTKEKYYAILDDMKKWGYELLLDGEFEGDIHYSYFETTEDFGGVLEISYFPPGVTDSGEIDYYIEPTCENWLGRFGQVGFVVKDCEAIAKNYTDKFNTRKWRICHLGEPGDENWAYVARAWMGNVDFEVIEPHTAPEALHQSWLDKWGNTIHHLSFYPETDEKYENAYKKLTDMGYENVGEGTYPGGVKFAYFDTQKDIGFITEIAYFPEGLTDPTPIDHFVE